MYRFLFLLFCFAAVWVGNVNAANVYLETETFRVKGGWVIDQQFMDRMGSPYLMAHGMGVPVEDAVTELTIPEKGVYYVYVRTFNWTSPWFSGKGPGKFSLYVDGKRVGKVLGDEGNTWGWQKAGQVRINKSEVEIRLRDLTGFNGRCDAVFFTTDKKMVPPTDIHELDVFRQNILGSCRNEEILKYDLIVVGGGVAGISAAVSAARLGCKVALINDRPVLGGNNSSEVRVHLGGRIETGLYKKLGNLQKEFGPVNGGNAMPAAQYEDEKKCR